MNNSKAKIIAVANQKGGVAKTTSVINIGAGLALKGKKVLLVDTDNQSHLSRFLGYNGTDDKPTISELIWQTVSKVQKPVSEATSDIKPYVLGMLVTMYNKRTNSARAIMDAMNESYGEYVFETAIAFRDEVKVATIEHKTLVARKNSITGQQYMAVVDEIIGKEGQGNG